LNQYLEAIVLGVVEGLTEFLPVSSTAHIRISQSLLGQDVQDEYWKMFAVVIQLGAILAVILYFRKRLEAFVRSYPKGERGTNTWWNHPLALVILSFVITAGPCFIIDDKIGELLENTTVMAWALSIGGVLMWAIDAWFSPRARVQSMDKMTFSQAIVIGLSQILAAAFPGTSRSMSTIAGGQIMGLSRSAALEFSFFLSIPVMFAATGYKLLSYLLKHQAPSGQQWGVLAVGFVVSFVVALAVIAWFMRWVRTRGFVPFAIYRILAGIVILVWLS
jgi:undecaprenyl-diphosphatase